MRAETEKCLGLFLFHVYLRLILPMFIYLFKINDRRTRGPLILSEEHRNT